MLGGGKDSNDSGGKMFDNPFTKSQTVVKAPVPSASVSLAPTAVCAAPKASVPFVPASLTRKPKQSSRSAFNLETGMMMAHPKHKRPSKQTEQPKVVASSVSSSAVAGSVDSSDDEAGDSSGASNFFSIPATNDMDTCDPDSSSLAGVSADVTATHQPGVPDSQVQDAPLSFKSSSSSRQFAPSSHSATKSSAYGNAYYNMAGVTEHHVDEGAAGGDVTHDNFQHDAEVSLRASTNYIAK